MHDTAASVKALMVIHRHILTEAAFAYLTEGGSLDPVNLWFLLKKNLENKITRSALPPATEVAGFGAVNSMIFVGSLLFILSSCFHSKPVSPLDLPSEVLENAVQDASTDPLFQPNTPLPHNWWFLFNDLQLNTCIETTFARSPTLQAARAKIFAAVFAAKDVKASLYPYLSWGADVSRQKLSKTGIIPFSSQPSGSGTPVVNVPVNPGGSGEIPEFFTQYETELNLKYSFDFWDKNRNTFRAALGQVQANIAEEAFTRLQLGIAVAQAYYDLQMNGTRKEIAKALVNNRLRYFGLVQKRVSANLENELSSQRAEIDLNNAQERLLQIQSDIAINEYQLKAYMAGSFDEEINALDITRQPLPRVPLPPDLPLHLIAQRPDIVAQLWLIQSAGREIEVAKAGFYPDFNLAALFGFQTIHLADLLRWPNSNNFIVNPAVSLPLFDGGRLAADLRASEIHYDLAMLEYNDLVMNATKEVLDAIVILRLSWRRLNASEKGLEHQQALYRLTSLRASHSLDNTLDELASEENLLIAQDQEVVALGRTIQAILGLIKALGGGYDPCYRPSNS